MTDFLFFELAVYARYIGFFITLLLWVCFWMVQNGDTDLSRLPDPSEMWRGQLAMLTLIGISFVCLLYGATH